MQTASHTIRSTIKRVVVKPHLPLILLVIFNIIIGVFTFQDYGLSWDEPLFYKYADAVGYAYSIQPRIEGTFDIQNAYGPSGDHALYGPAYLLIARNFVYIFEKVTGISSTTLWHLLNFITLQVGVIFLYLLTRRWVSAWASFSAALLFSTQPLVWGHAFINPKDIPFLVFFLAALYLGLRFIDHIVSKDQPDQNSSEMKPVAWSTNKRPWIIVGLLTLALILFVILFNPLIESWMRAIMDFFYTASPNSIWGRLFHAIAEDADKVGVDYYAEKILSMYYFLRIILIAILLPIFIFSVSMIFWPAASQQRWQIMVSSLKNITYSNRNVSFWQALKKAAIPGIVLGLAVSIRILGILVGVLVVVLFLILNRRRPIRELAIYTVIALVTTYVTWPYLWYSPIKNFVEVIQLMSNNPQPVGLIFNGAELNSTILPWTYLPALLGITLTEPVWFLFFFGLAFAVLRIINKQMQYWDFSVTFLGFLIPFLYVIIFHPPMYDGFRHFLFILPPIFVVIGVTFDTMIKWFHRPVIPWVLLTIVTIPGVVGIVNLHPFEYTYYNVFVGGPSGTYRLYENDYWLTCYLEAMQPFDAIANENPTVYVMRQPNLAENYAVEGVEVLPYKAPDLLESGDYILLSTRSNLDLKFTQESDVRWTIGRQGATYCIVKQAR
jgi:hypothetical protein